MLDDSISQDLWRPSFVVGHPDPPTLSGETPEHTVHGTRSFPPAVSDSFDKAPSPYTSGREIGPSPAATSVPLTQFPFFPYPLEAHPALYPERKDPIVTNGVDWNVRDSSSQPAINQPALLQSSDLPSHSNSTMLSAGEFHHFRPPPNSYPPEPSARYYDTMARPSRSAAHHGSTVYTDYLPRWNPYMDPRLGTQRPVIEQRRNPELNEPRNPVEPDAVSAPRDSPPTTWGYTPPDDPTGPIAQSAGSSTPEGDKISFDHENVTGLHFPPEHPEWTLTSDLYQWIFAVLYPKKRPNKKIPTPTGACRLCRSDCKRPGILQQHLRVLHRQRLARRALAGQTYNVELALTFVVADVRSTSPQPGPPLVAECDEFLRLVDRPGGLGSLPPEKLPVLRWKLAELIQGEDWIGVQCKGCGMWATRQVALNEHTAVCVGKKQSDLGANTESSARHQLRFTPSGLAARPPRRRRQES